MRIRPFNRIPQQDDEFHLRVVFPDSFRGMTPIHIDGSRLTEDSVRLIWLKAGMKPGVVAGGKGEVVVIVKEVQLLSDCRADLRVIHQIGIERGRSPFLGATHKEIDASRSK